MAPAYDLKLALTRVIEPTGGPGAELATLEDAARFIGQMKTWRQARPYWDFAAVAEGRGTATPGLGELQLNRSWRLLELAPTQTSPPGELEL